MTAALSFCISQLAADTKLFARFYKTRYSSYIQEVVQRERVEWKSAQWSDASLKSVNEPQPVTATYVNQF